MKPIVRILKYLRFFPVDIAMNLLFNVLHILFNVGSYVMIIPFVGLMFGLGDAPAAEPHLGLDQQQLVDWAFWHLYQYRDTVGLAVPPRCGRRICGLLAAEQPLPFLGAGVPRPPAQPPD